MFEHLTKYDNKSSIKKLYACGKVSYLNSKMSNKLDVVKEALDDQLTALEIAVSLRNVEAIKEVNSNVMTVNGKLDELLEQSKNEAEQLRKQRKMEEEIEELKRKLNNAHIQATKVARQRIQEMADLDEEDSDDPTYVLTSKGLSSKVCFCFGDM